MTTHDRPVRRYMTALPHTIGVEQSLDAASRRMTQLGVRHLPVLYGGVLCGVVSERDILFLRSATGIDPDRTAVEEAMSPEPFVVGPEMPLGAVARGMAKRRIGSAIVVEGSEVLGILTTTDALAILADIMDAVSSTLRPALSANEVRKRILEEHRMLRGMLATATSLATRALDANDSSDAELHVHARELYRTLVRHLDIEDLILEPVLRRRNAGGATRAEALLHEHRMQRKELQGALRQLDEEGTLNLASALQTFVPRVLEDMDREEAVLLSDEALAGSSAHEQGEVESRRSS